jgi:HK97 family phage portal protein
MASLMSATAPPAAVVQNADVPSSLITRGSGEVWDAFTGGGSNGNIPIVNEHTANNVTAIYACVNLRAGLIAAMPVKIMEVDASGDEIEIANDPLLTILNNEFCARWASHVGWDYMERSRCFHGDAFTEIKRSGSKIIGLVPHHPLRVRVSPWRDGTRLAYEITPDPWATDRGSRVIDQDDMIHVTGPGFDGCRSMSPLRYSLRMSGAVALAAQDYSAQFFSNNSTPPYALQADGTPSGEAIEKLRADIAEKHSRASGNIGKPMLLTDGLKVQMLGLTNDDSALIETRRFQIEEIARSMQVQPFMIGHNDKATGLPGGLVQMLLSFKKLQFQPQIVAYENELTRKLIRQPNRKIVFDTFALETGDIKTLLEALRIALGRAGEDQMMTINEVRKYLRMNRVEGGDELKKGEPDAQQSA